jgi:hypothetical protein
LGGKISDFSGSTPRKEGSSYSEILSLSAFDNRGLPSPDPSTQNSSPRSISLNKSFSSPSFVRQKKAIYRLPAKGVFTAFSDEFEKINTLQGNVKGLFFCVC